MKFTCEKQVLYDAISVVQKAVPSKSTLPILEGILITAEEDYVLLTGNNLEIGIECKIEASVLKKGSAVLNGRVFGDIVKNLPKDIVHIECDNNLKTTISCQKSEYEIIALNAEEFPEIPGLYHEQALKISAPILKSMIRQTIYAVSLSDSKPTFTGSLFDIKEGTLTIVSVDGFRLALRKEEIGEKELEDKFIVPGKTLNELSRIIRDEDSDILIKKTDRHVLFEYGNSKIISRLLDGNFVKYESVIPVDFEIKTSTHLGDFLKSVERTDPIVSLDIYDSPVKLTIDDDVIEVSCMTATGRVHDVVATEPCGKRLEIGFYQKYLLDALKACEEERIRLFFNTSLTPCVIKPEEGDKFIFMLSPVRFRSDE